MSNMPSPPQTPNHHVILLIGTHVTGKDTLGVTLSKVLGCPWIKGDSAHAAANIAARSQAARGGYNYGDVFQRIWFAKIQRLGLAIPDTSRNALVGGRCEIPTEGVATRPWEPVQRGVTGNTTLAAPPPSTASSNSRCIALITTHAMRKPARDAIRQILRRHFIKPSFVILHITKETLSGRTLGAEEPGLAERIMDDKRADIEEPGTEEIQEAGDVVMVDSAGASVEGVFDEILRGVEEAGVGVGGGGGE